MLRVEHYIPDKANWLIRQFETFRFTEPFLEEKYIPRPDVCIIFHFKDTPLIEENPPIMLGHFFAAPIITRSLILSCHGEMETLVVACKPTVLSRIFNLDLSPVWEHGIELPHKFFHPLWQVMLSLKTVEERIDCFNRFVGKIQNTHYCPDEEDQLYDKILENGTTMLLKDIMKDCGASQRTLERNFVKRTGVSPKRLMRIVRIDYLWTKIKDENAIDYQGLVFDGNYFDQSHFINDFKTVIGETPGYFFKRNLSVVKMFSGREDSCV